MDNERKRRELHSELRKRQDVHEEILARTLDDLCPWRRKRSGVEIAITNLVENRIPSLHKWYNDSRKQVIQSLQVPVP